MTIKELLKMGYKQLPNKENGVTTLCNKFENGNIYIFQFNEELKEEHIGAVYLTNKQLQEIILTK